MKNLMKILISLMLLICISSCVSNNDIVVELSVGPQYSFLKPCLDWGGSKSQIASKMVDYDLVLNEDNTLCYQSNSETIAYAFKNDKLNTVVVIPSSTLSLDEIKEAFVGYTLLSQYDNIVYLNKDSNTIAEIEKNYGYYTISWSQYDLEMANAIDLGLSVKWADVNLDVGYDDYAALTPENNQDDVTKFLNGLIGWGDPTGVKKSEIWSDYPEINSISGSIYDVARAKWGGKWRIATQNEYLELINACIWTWEQRNGCYGYKITGPNGNSIFLPTTGYRDGYTWYNSDNGYYWTGTMRPNNTYYPYVLIFNNVKKGLNITSLGLAYLFRSYGCAIRPVKDK